MKFTPLLREERAVTPVVGIVMIIALAVILAALVGSHTLGIGRDTTSNVPNVAVSWDYDETVDEDVQDSWGTVKDDADSGSYEGLLTITHDHGERVPPELLTIEGASSEPDGPFTEDSELAGQEFFASEDSVTVWVSADDTVRVVWRNPEGSKTGNVAVWNGA